MIIDTHCHFDMMPNPEEYIRQAEASGNITFGMTNLPSHFEKGFIFVRSFPHTRLALGFHPLLAAKNQHELPNFVRFIDQTSYIGEIGLDFSKEGYATKEQQLASLHYILSHLQGKNKIISVHSRGAEKVLLALLREYRVKNVIFHWYSGSISLISDILAEGYYFSVNEYMTTSLSGQRIVAKIPRNRILTETDAPFNQKVSIERTLANLQISQNDIYGNLLDLLKDIKRI